MLLALMLLIQGVKLLHTHKSACSKYINTHGLHAHKGVAETACNICEFQLAKDKHFITHFALIIEKPSLLHEIFCSSNTFIPSIIFFDKDARGPPPLVQAVRGLLFFS